MKIRIRRMLSLLLMLGLFAAFLCGGAFAVDVPEISCELGTALDYTIPLEGGGSATGIEILGGSLPSGVDVKIDEGAAKLVGTPEASGDYSFQLKISTEAGAEEYALTVKVSEPAPTSEPTPFTETLIPGSGISTRR